MKHIRGQPQEISSLEVKLSSFLMDIEPVSVGAYVLQLPFRRNTSVYLLLHVLYLQILQPKATFDVDFSGSLVCFIVWGGRVVY